MFIENPRQSIEQLTQLYSGERSADGRPHVPDDLLTRMEQLTTEQAWGVLRRHGYHSQFEGGWFATHGDKTLVGRAVTAMLVPRRPDLNDLVEEMGKAEGRIGGQNSWVIDTLQPGDVMVVDMWGKIKDGTFVGDNLSTSLRARTGRGAVLNAGIRDYQGVRELDDLAIFCRGLHPTAIADYTLAGINIPIRIGEVTVLPGDIVLGTPTGVIFVPPHLAQEVVETGENVRLRDEFGKLRLREGKYTPGEIDVSEWPDYIETDYQAWAASRRG